ncbi:Ribosomal RNA-processing protein [Actinidia chinensis var. chinensis]|uniref:Ribosomal RNA-processing protein n=1 Tax=Actinidia chinensis var. chinensis TaxID=1590841 RepID=A0A2R6QKC5_ACTCC|nr:Ribosomal RNA-processing protein [Actinidia chinensis var. chinensis]
MNGDKKMGSSASSSFTSDLFGSNESSASSSSGILGSIFSPSSKVLGRESLRSEVVEKKQNSASQFWTTNSGAAQDTIPRRSEGENQSPTNEDKSQFYQEQRVQPCHLSSSIYYGGQDVYSPPKKAQDSGHTTFHNDKGEDDSGSASRGNWWQGSLYY